MTYVNKKLLELKDNPALDGWLNGVAIEIVNGIKESMVTMSPGQTRTRYNPKRTVVAAGPGQVPNVDLGHLRLSIGWVRVKKNLYYIHDGVPYGVNLETGTSKMQARPFMRPQFKIWKKKIAADFKAKKVIS